jgi:starch synthase (maltosyl-transferring)
LRFWEWLIAEVRAEHPQVIMLAEAFTRPRVMEYLAKIGFSQSYTYFTWRNSAAELRDYLTEVTKGPMADYFRPNLWPNTPDILHEFLQRGGRPAFSIRLLLAATLAANYGIYGPPFELAVSEPRSPGSEEYLHSEKFEVHHWKIDPEASLAKLIATVNSIRHDHPALQQNRTLHFHGSNNDQLLVYSKTSGGSGETGPASEAILVVVTLDPTGPQEATVHLDLGELGVDGARPYYAHDLLTGIRYTWIGADNYVLLDPAVMAAHVFSIEQGEPVTP